MAESLSRPDSMVADPQQTITDLRRANAELRRRLDERTAERDAALEQQTATAEVLGVINSSPGDLAPVFETVLEKGNRLCDTALGVLWTYESGYFSPGAVHGPQAFVDAIKDKRRPAANGGTLYRHEAGEQLVHIEDMAAESAVYGINPTRRVFVDLGGARSALSVALRKDGTLLGALQVYRQEVRPFTDKQIALLQNFAAQAVIAMENARLLGELQQRTGDLEESLEHQIATSEVLQVISRSTFDLQRVLETLAESAASLAQSDTVFIFRREGDAVRLVAQHAPTPAFGAAIGRLKLGPDRTSTTGRALLTGEVVRIANVQEEPDYQLHQSELDRIGSTMAVPLLGADETIGVITLARLRVEPYSDRHLDLVRTFADQAVIAIENARLISETREALEQQTATAEVLQVINASPGDLAPVFDAMLEKALRLCEADIGTLWTYDGELMHPTAIRCPSPGFAEFLQQGGPRPPARPQQPLLLGERFVQVADLSATEGYRDGDPIVRAVVDLGGVRTLLNMALRTEEKVLGLFAVYRRDVRPFTDKQIALLQNFAAQAVIAMENARLITETREALEQQTATAEVLQAINSSPGDLAPVFDAILEKAHNLCGIAFGSLQLYDGGKFRAVAVRGVADALAEVLRQPLEPLPETPAARLLAGERFVQIADVIEAAKQLPDETRAQAAVAHGLRTVLFVPLRREADLLGYIAAFRKEVRPFTEKQITLLQNFAAQAVIAMENARLITETREALEQQTATAEVLQVINSSPGDLAPVFEAMLGKAVQLCAAAHGSLRTFDGEAFHLAATDAGSGFLDLANQLGPIVTYPGHPMEPLIRGEAFVHLVDARETPAYRSDEGMRQRVDAASIRSWLAVALRQDETLLGAILLHREEVRPFSAKEIALLQNFAAQAAIAMENARLLSELRASLEQQQAIAEVLQVINASAGNLQPVFEVILDKAHSLCGASRGTLFVVEGRYCRGAAAHGYPRDLADRLRQPALMTDDHFAGSLLGGARLIHNPDLRQVDHPAARDVAQRGGVRTNLLLPLRKDGTLLGYISCNRQEVRPFTDREIGLLESFAAQAVIAMDNARLLDEIRQRQAELRVTFDNMGDGVAMFDADLKLAAWNGNFQKILDLPDQFVAQRPGLEAYIRHLVEHGEYGTVDVDAEVRRLTDSIGTQWTTERTRPDGRVIEVRVNPVPGGGAVLIYSDVTERKRAEAEIRDARDAAERALGELKAAQASLVHAEKMASLGQLTAGIAHEIKNPLNFVNNFAGLSVELLGELTETAAPGFAALGEDARAEIDETVAMLASNLDKIAEHGQRADGIVKSMLAHSRGTSGERQAVDLNGLVEEALNLAYHGARAQDQNFNITLERDFAAGLQPIELVPQDVARVFLNLIGNGFHAAHKRQTEAGEVGFRPVLRVMTRDLGDAVEVRVCDNGTGIRPEHRDKLFQPFFTTKPTGEGTGLGLSISYDIVTQQHGGTIAVDSEMGEFTEFTVRLPRAPQPKTTGRAA